MLSKILTEFLSVAALITCGVKNGDFRKITCYISKIGAKQTHGYNRWLILNRWYVWPYPIAPLGIASLSVTLNDVYWSFQLLETSQVIIL